jgi:Ion transport protein
MIQPTNQPTNRQHRATSYLFEDDTPVPPYVGVDCVCPPAPLFSTIVFNDCCVYFFTVEWVLRVLSFAPAEHNRAKTYRGLIRQWYRFLTEATTVLDALAIFPYYLERFNSSKGLLSLRLLRLFRVFQLVRLGQYNTTFNVFTNVLAKSMIHLKLLLIVLVFGAAFFGSMVYWLEKGEWAYWDETGQFEFVRMSSNGATPEISPFFSIPQAFWWFLVTATTVGYGDISPTTTGGKLVAIAAMLTGVLVIAFPVSVFSDLWHKELAHHGALYTELLGEEAENDDDEELVIPRVAMDPKDVKQLAKEFQAMNCAHERIRGIFEKYDIPID